MWLQRVRNMETPMHDFGEGSLMKKLLLLIGFAVGFVAGSKAGTGPYNQLQSKVRSFTRELERSGAAGKPQGASVKSQGADGMSYPEVVDPIGGVMTPSAASTH